MAFYSARIDDDGNEIERRSMQMPDIAIYSEDSDPNFDTGYDDFETKSFDDNCSLNQETGLTERASDYDYNGKSIGDTVSLRGRMAMFDEQSEIVPPLDIRSELNFQTGGPLTYKAKRKYETAKIVLEPNKHYEDWLERKRQRQLDEAARQKREEEKKRQEAEERKRLAEEKYQKWLEKKKSSSNGFDSISNRKPAAASSGTTTGRSTSSEINAMDKKKKLEEWMRNKQKKEYERRLKEQLAAEKRAKQEAARKMLNKGAHEKWLERNKNAPKPVPLNQGFATLRGTVSKIFVNPNEWRTD